MIFTRLRQLSRYMSFLFPVALIAMYVWSSVQMSSATAATQASVGVVDTLRGKGWGVSAEGAKYDKLKGDVVAMNEVLATGYKSGMTMSFIDGTTMKLGADAQITIDEMVYDPANDENDSVVMHLNAGAFYFVSGKVAKKKVTLITPTVTIGIRGTELLISVEKDGSTSVGVAKGRAYMRSRDKSGRTEISLGSTARADAKGNVSQSHKGLDLTGDDDIDRNVEGVSDWIGDDDKKKHDDLTEFSSDDGKDDDDKEDGKDGNDDDGEDRGDGEDSRDEGDSDGEGDDNDGENDGEMEMEGEDGESEGDSGEGDGGDGDGGDSDGGDSDGGDSDGGDSDGGDSDGGDSDGGDSDGGDSDGGDSDSSRDSHHD